jgi:hypothetical protein
VLGADRAAACAELPDVHEARGGRFQPDAGRAHRETVINYAALLRVSAQENLLASGPHQNEVLLAAQQLPMLGVSPSVAAAAAVLQARMMEAVGHMPHHISRVLGEATACVAEVKTSTAPPTSPLLGDTHDSTAVARLHASASQHLIGLYVHFSDDVFHELDVFTNAYASWGPAEHVANRLGALQDEEKARLAAPSRGFEQAGAQSGYTPGAQARPKLVPRELKAALDQVMQQVSVTLNAMKLLATSLQALVAVVPDILFHLVSEAAARPAQTHTVASRLGSLLLGFAGPTSSVATRLAEGLDLQTRLVAAGLLLEAEVVVEDGPVTESRSRRKMPLHQAAFERTLDKIVSSMVAVLVPRPHPSRYDAELTSTPLRTRPRAPLAMPHLLESVPIPSGLALALLQVAAPALETPDPRRAAPASASDTVLGAARAGLCSVLFPAAGVAARAFPAPTAWILYRSRFVRSLWPAKTHQSLLEHASRLLSDSQPAAAPDAHGQGHEAHLGSRGANAAPPSLPNKPLAAFSAVIRFLDAFDPSLATGRKSSRTVAAASSDDNLWKDVGKAKTAIGQFARDCFGKRPDAEPLLLPVNAALRPPLHVASELPSAERLARCVFRAGDIHGQSIASKAKPMILHFPTPAGRPIALLLKQGDDLRCDSRIGDIVTLANATLASSTAFQGSASTATLRSYAVVPTHVQGLFSPHHCGFVEILAGARTLNSLFSDVYVTARRVARHKFSSARLDTSGMRALFEKKQKEARDSGRSPDAAAYRDILAKYPPFFGYYWCSVGLESSPERVHQFRRAYTDTLAVWSMLGWILKLGDRHLENIMMLPGARIAHIDFEAIFEHGRYLPVPELIPFRLTPNLTHALGPAGAKGRFTQTAVKALTAFSAGAEPALKSPIDIFRFDPFYSRRSVAQGVLDANARLDGVLDGRRLDKQAIVIRLIAEATDESRLIRTYVGWSPFL